MIRPFVVLLDDDIVECLEAWRDRPTPFMTDRLIGACRAAVLRPDRRMARNQDDQGEEEDGQQ